MALPGRQGPIAALADNPIIRTAICAEARDGVLYVFMPPVDALEDYLDLVAAVEATAADLGVPRRPRGVPAADDPRLRQLPDHARPRRHRGQRASGAAAGTSSSNTTTVLYEEARQARLVTEKFMLDGRHTGTGGGNHVVLGGATPPTVRSCAGRICCAAS